jgi:hypothetical protein
MNGGLPFVPPLYWLVRGGRCAPFPLMGAAFSLRHFVGHGDGLMFYLVRGNEHIMERE